ncbi:hypothetical protein L3Y34_000544 [Caenorhabditis briggsae]|uniref:Uncharacterized protein n=1 Tax=Caenorhabditis briggsae TaxID=6238 RepID=A0AAE9D9J7_CAEBR|nr:hypothetical protein L3Y34_000544 [Caenorhabditis briggsae]
MPYPKEKFHVNGVDIESDDYTNVFNFFQASPRGYAVLNYFLYNSSKFNKIKTFEGNEASKERMRITSYSLSKLTKKIRLSPRIRSAQCLSVEGILDQLPLQKRWMQLAKGIHIVPGIQQTPDLEFCRIPPSCVSINRMRLSFVLGCQNAVPWCYTIQLLELDSKLI